MSRIILLTVALGIIVPVGYVQGRWTGRWSSALTFESRLKQFDQIPLTFGSWHGQWVGSDPDELKRAGVVGGRMLRYESATDGTISVMIVCGRPGPTSVHTPEICYAGAGYDLASPRTKVTVASGGASPDTFWTTDMLKQETLTPEYLRIFHAWGNDGTWHASSNPRYDFANAGLIDKLYVVRAMSRLNTEPQDDRALKFLQEFVPVVRSILQPSSSESR